MSAIPHSMQVIRALKLEWPRGWWTIISGRLVVHADGKIEKEKVEMSPSRPIEMWDRRLDPPDVFVGWLDLLELPTTRLCGQLNYQ